MAFLHLVYMVKESFQLSVWNSEYHIISSVLTFNLVGLQVLLDE